MAWYSASWSHRKPLTVAAAKVGAGGVSNFAVRARLTSDTAIAPKARFDGADILVTSSDGTTKLPHAMVRYDPIARADAVWTWYNDPRAVYANGQTFVGWITTDGQVQVGAYNHTAATWTIGTITTGFQVDDHDNPALLIRDDGKILAVYSEHPGTAYSVVSTNAYDVSAWGTPVAFSGSRSYAHLIKLGSGRIYYFFRDGASGTMPQAFQTSDDSGATWSSKTTLFTNTSQRPYGKYALNNTDNTRIEVAVTDGHPNEVSTNSVYHFYLTDSGSGASAKKTDGTSLTLPVTPADLTKVYDGTTNRGWIWDVATTSDGLPAMAYTIYVGGTTTQRYHYSKWNGSAWVNNLIVTAGDTYGLTEAYYSPGICLNHSDANTAYLVRLTASVPVWKYVTSDHGASWTPTAIGNKGSSVNKTLRPVCPRNAHADIPVLWLYGTYTGYATGEFNTNLIVPFAPACTTTTVDLFFKASTLSDAADSTFYLYYGNSGASAQEDVANTFPDDVLVVPGGDRNWEQLDLIVPAASQADKEPGIGTLSASEDSAGTNGPWQNFVGTTDTATGQSPSFANATAFTIVISAQPLSGGDTTPHWLSNFIATGAGIIFRYTTADMQPACIFVRQADTNIGGKFPDITVANGVKRRWYARWSTTSGILEMFRDLTLSSTTFANSTAMDAGASAEIYLGSTPHSTTSTRYKGYLEGIRLLKNKRWSDAEVTTDYNNHTNIGTFLTIGSQEAMPVGGVVRSTRTSRNRTLLRM